MQMDAGTFKDIAAGVQSIILACATITAGGWAIYTFSALGTIQKNQAELTDVQQRIQREPALEISLKATIQGTIGKQDKQDRIMCVVASVKNSGSIALELDAASVCASKVKNVSNTSVETTSIILGRSFLLSPTVGEDIAESRFLRPSQSRDLIFLMPINDKGDFLVQFAAEYYGADLHAGKPKRTNDAGILAFSQILAHVE